ncbi:GNAT family N-acetyltransferase [Streptomyces sp. NPDC091272]|uniref:GNAT family N-acetyltransferase n=1 Tax=Streptomyces sp. NPDC091272 TaxID=3365981 RepID=UPI003826F16F
MAVRDFRPDSSDVAAIVELRRAALPYNVTTAESVVFQMASASPAARLRYLLAEDTGSGQVVGVLRAQLSYQGTETGHASCIPVVHPEHRGRGAGSALLRAGEEYLGARGATALHVWALDAPSRAFAEKRGYTRSHSMHYQRLDLAAVTLPEPPPLPAGLTLCGADVLGDDPRPLFEADAEAARDEPGSVGTVLDDYDDWLRTVWNVPLLDRALTTLAVTDDGTVAAFTLAHTDGASRYSSGMTGTRRAFRALGLAKAVKSHSLRRSRAAGCREAFTSNDDVNTAMLTVNRWLGYGHGNTEVEYVRTLG